MTDINLINTTLDQRYLILGLLGEGGMGAVYEARHLGTGRRVAVKVITSKLAQDEAVMARFEREARAAGAIESEHIAGVLDSGRDRATGLPFLVMELLSGEDVDQLLRRLGPLPPELALCIVAQACMGLIRAHDARVLHRDIKPANLFLCRYGADLDFLKVLDFGLVAERRKDVAPSTLTEDNAITGTPAFMAPEVVLGDRPVDGRTDIYALGCVAYWLLTGALVFEAETAMKTVLLHATEAPVAPSKRAARTIPPALDRIVLDCLEKDPARRPRSARELSERLAALHMDAEWTEQHAAAWWEAVAPPSLPGRPARAAVDAFG